MTLEREIGRRPSWHDPDAPDWVGNFRRRESWRDLATCATPEAKASGADWFSDKGTVAAARAVAICEACPVREDCLRDCDPALDDYIGAGIRGGLHSSERRARRVQARRRQAAA
jgi:hypothetical protein